MKKLLVLMSVGILALGIAGCGGSGSGSGQESGSQQGISGQESGSQQGSGGQESGSQQGSGGQESGSQQGNDGQMNPGEGDSSGGIADGGDYSDGWSTEMQGAKDVAAEVLGENYWPDMMLQPEELEVFFGVSPDMYEDYMAEMCMISANVDTLIVLKAGEDQIQAAEDALNAYRDAKVSDTMQYPMNLGKIQASVVERHGSYVYFVQLGADMMDVEVEEAVTLCREANQSVIRALNQYFGVE
ncbi:MAG: DUF4358 domain-containing protein [Roseburia sp.]|nr:DUF4358 domain-containing protein [Roseburia sp.]MCM1098608.1 DUF4358 domain-containing protein [Ruminococcus flavefaciens]